jgi:VanZ family protein
MDEGTRETIGGLSKARSLRARWRWALVMVYILAIFVASSQSNISIPGGMSDKTAHGVAYSGLSWLIAWGLVDGDCRRIRLGTVLLATILATAYGLSDEVHQLFVPRRSFEWLDLAADASGAFAGASTGWAWGILLRWSTRAHGV